MASVPVDTLKPGDVILPPARELSLWMRKDCAAKGLAETALHLTIMETYEGVPDKRGRWRIVRCAHTPEWLGGRRDWLCVFKARPTSPWPVVSRKEPTC